MGIDRTRIVVFLVGVLLMSCVSIVSFGQGKRKFTEQEQRINDVSAAQAKRAMTFSSKALQVGNKVPDILLGKIFNYPGGQAKLYDFKGRHILLDFWSRYCKSCIGAFPKVEKLQQQFADQIQILAVCTYNTWESLNLLEPGFPKKSSSRIIQQTSLPLAFDSQEMVDFFPHFSEPYLVWIDTAMIVRAMIDGWNFNEVMVSTLLKGEYDAYPLATSFKKILAPEKFTHFDQSSLSILEEGNGRQISKVVYLKRSEDNSTHVVLARLGMYAASFGKLICDSTNDLVVGELRLRLSIADLFRAAYPVEKQLVLWESFNPEKYYIPSTNFDQWASNYLYSYEVYGKTPGVRQTLLRNALSEYFKYIQPVVKKRNIRCFELHRTSASDKLASKYLNRVRPHIETSESLFALRNCDYSFFLESLQEYNLSIHRHKAIPIFDATGFPGRKKIDIELRNLKNIEDLNIQLREYDLALKEAEREVEVLVLTELTTDNLVTHNKK